MSIQSGPPDNELKSNKATRARYGETETGKNKKKSRRKRKYCIQRTGSNSDERLKLADRII
jgi:hypothetical protein